MTGALAQYAALMDLGVSRASGRYIALFHAKGDTKSEGAVVVVCIMALSALTFVLSGFAVLGAPAADHILHTGEPRRASLLLWCAVAIMVLGLSTRIFSSISTGHGRLVQAGIGLAVLSTLQSLGGIVGLILRASLEAFAFGTVCGALMGLIAMISIVIIDERGIPRSIPTLAVAREVFGYGLKSQAGNAGDILQLQSGKLIAGILIGPAAAGLYDLASKLALGAQAFAAAAGSALVPHLTSNFVAGGLERILTEYERLTRRSTAAVIFIPFAMAATASTSVPLWLNGRHTEVVLLLLALLPGIAINASTVACSSTASAIGRPGILAQVSILAGVFLVLVAVTLGLIFGFVGIGIAFAVGFPLAMFAGIWYTQARLKIPQLLYFRGVSGPFLIAVVATIAALPIGLIAAPHSRGSAVWPFLGSVLVFTAVYLHLSWRAGYLPSAQLKHQLTRRR